MADPSIWNIVETGISVMIGGGITYFVTRKRNQADAAELITRAAGNLVGKFESRVAQLETDIEDQKCITRRYAQRVINLMSGIKRLISQITALGHIPEWQPDEWSPDGEAENDT